VNAVPRCRYCRRSTDLDRGRAWTLFVPPLDRIVHHFKYRQGLRLGRLLGLGMTLVMRYDPILASSDLIAPVPLFWLKKMRRGYNQAQALAAVVSRETGIPVCDGLRRIRFTRTQTRLPDRRRTDNVRGAFRLRPDADVAGKKVLLVDDVMTTGATIRECARVLKNAGADRVYSLVAAITP
jgi:ComF family protein